MPLAQYVVIAGHKVNRCIQLPENSQPVSYDSVVFQFFRSDVPGVYDTLDLERETVDSIDDFACDILVNTVAEEYFDPNRRDYAVAVISGEEKLKAANEKLKSAPLTLHKI